MPSFFRLVTHSSERKKRVGVHTDVTRSAPINLHTDLFDFTWKREICHHGYATKQQQSRQHRIFYHLDQGHNICMAVSADFLFNARHVFDSDVITATANDEVSVHIVIADQ